MYETLILTLPTLILCGAFIVFLVQNNNFASKTSALFCISAVVIILLTITDSLKAELPIEYVYLKRFLYPLGVVLRTTILYLISLISNRQYSHFSFYEAVLAIPLILTTLFSFISIFFGIIVSVNEVGEMIRGPLYVLPFVACGCYFIVLTYLTIKNYKIKNFREFSALTLLIVSAILATLLEAEFSFRHLLPGTAIVAISFYNMLLHNNTNNRDRLTGCRVRNRFYEDGLRHDVTAVIITDLNGLKKINDRLGHAEGDRAICAMVGALYSAIKNRNADVYRLGGDEFAVLCTRMTEDEVISVIKEIHLGMIDSGYACAVGYAMKTDKTSDLDTLCRIADAEMYKNKVKS